MSSYNIQNVFLLVLNSFFDNDESILLSSDTQNIERLIIRVAIWACKPQ